VNSAGNLQNLAQSLSGCGKKDSECDEETADFVIEVYRQGHKGVLGSLISAGVNSDGALAETLGVFYANTLENAAREFVQAISQQSKDTQVCVCRLAGSGDGSGINSQQALRIQNSLHRIGGGAGMRCLKSFREGRQLGSERNESLAIGKW
jgi:hypothetical protein